MNSNQRSQGNNQSDNGGNEKSVSSSRGGTVEKDNMNQSQQSGTLNGSGQALGDQGSQRQGSIGERQGGNAQASTDRTGSQTGNEQNANPQMHQSNDAAGGYPRSPGTKNLSADRKMDDDTGLSNTVNQQQPIDEGSRQMEQSNVGRRSDMTPD